MAGLILETLAGRDDKTRRRLRSSAMAALDYAVIALLLAGFAWAGTIPSRLAWLFVAAGLVINAGFLLAIRSGFSLRYRDPAMTLAQISAACVVDLVGLVLAPAIAHLFIVVLFVPLSYGILYFNQRTFLAAWAYVSVAMGLALALVGRDATIALNSLPEQILTWMVSVFALGRFLSMNAAVSTLRANLKRKNEELTSATGKLTELASRDELTGLWNRREFMRLLQDEARRAARNQTSFCVAIIDIDHFKAVNDEYGHLVGDAVLRELGQLLEFSRRATDTVGRYGGEEFTLLLQGARLSTAMVALERTRNIVAQHDWTGIAPRLQLTISAGIAAWYPGDTLTAVMNRADEALYDAKHAGRNCVRTRERPASLA